MGNEGEKIAQSDPAEALGSMDEFVKSGKKMDVLYSNIHPVLLMQNLQMKLEENGITALINEDDWSLSYQVPMKNMQQPADEEEKEVEVESEIKLNV